MGWIDWVEAVVLLACLFALLVRGAGQGDADREVARRLAVLDRKLDLIMDHLQIRDPGPEVPAGVLQELVSGRKIQAIKLYREATGAGLKEAKDAVDALAQQRGLG
ncbi:ribosomal protein L7/L12 [Dactylosporangium sp. CA-092794]|uniref:ribosomal protein L7/L12 n=1 Tax=Dactylosporangium sp. CA-092794 TaxID=3239929 RepID=UPI003D9225AF